MKCFTISTSIAVILGLGIALGLLWGLGGGSVPVVAAPVEAPRAPVAELHVCLSGCTYSSIQVAVDAANDGDVIKVATGIYTGVQGRPAPAGYYGPSVITQVVYISKTVTVRGGYTTAFTDPPDPDANPTTLDARQQGRVIYITGDISPTIEGLRINGGNADRLGSDSGWRDAGGGVYVSTATVVISDSQVFSNTAEHGGGLYLCYNIATLNSNTVFSNTATRGGGGLSLYHSDAALSRNTFTSNTADLSGGGVDLLESRVTFSDNIISSNTNGGLSLDNSYGSVIDGNTVVSNIGSGVGLYRGSAMLNNNVVISNSGDGLTLWQSNSTLNDNTVYSNTGRGLSLRYSDAILNDNIVSFNGDGGLFLYESDATLSGNTVTFNTADTGGGLYLNYSDATLINNIIAGNQVIATGGGLYILSSSPRLLHTTLARNGGGDGSGIYITSEWGIFSNVALTNTILVSHTVGITVTVDNMATLGGALWGSGAWANGSDWGGSGMIITGTPAYNYWGDPAFVDPDAGDYHISLGSAAVDAGVDVGVPDDIDGDPRTDGYPDIGADELASALLVTKQAHPDTVQPGGQLTYTIRVTNTGAVTLTATITDTLSDHITLGKTSGGTLILPGGVVTWTPVSIAPEEVWTDTVVVTVEVGYAGPLTNVVEVTSEEGITGFYVHTLAPGLDVSKQAHVDTVQAGKQLTYTIYVTNTGNFDLHATITDTLPEHVTTTQALVWPSQLIPSPGGVWTETVVVTVEMGYAGPLTNVVEVTTEEGVTGIYTETSTALYVPPNQAPYTPSDPTPNDGTSDVPITQTFSWQGGDPDGDPVTYTVAFGTSDPPPFATTTTLTSYTPSLVTGTTYYWIITATDGLSESVGVTWSFTTVVIAPPNQAPHTPSNPTPADFATDVPITQTLSWQGGDPDGDLVTYTVALGTSDPPSFATTTMLTSYTPSLITNTTYYWVITATDGISTTVGPTWRFSTMGFKYVYLPLVLRSFP